MEKGVRQLITLVVGPFLLPKTGIASCKKHVFKFKSLGAVGSQEVHAFFIAAHLNDGQGDFFLAHHLDDFHKFVQVQRGIFFGFIFKEIEEGGQHLHLPMVVCSFHDHAQHARVAYDPLQQLLQRDIVDIGQHVFDEFACLCKFIREIFFEKTSCNGIGLDINDVPES